MSSWQTFTTLTTFPTGGGASRNQAQNSCSPYIIPLLDVTFSLSKGLPLYKGTVGNVKGSRKGSWKPLTNFLYVTSSFISCSAHRNKGADWASISMEHLGVLPTECASAKETWGQREGDYKRQMFKKKPKTNTFITWKKEKEEENTAHLKKLRARTKRTWRVSFTVKQTNKLLKGTCIQERQREKEICFHGFETLSPAHIKNSFLLAHVQ